MLKVTVHDFLVQSISIGVLKWKVATDHSKQDNTATPNVYLGAMVLFAGDHLWSCVTWRTTRRFQSLFRLVGIAESKIDNFDLTVMIEEEVLGLHISMNYTELVEIVDPRDDLLKEFAGFLLTQFVKFHDVFEKFAAGDIFRNEVKLPRSLNDLVELDDVRVPG